LAAADLPPTSPSTSTSPDQLVADGKTISFTGEIVNNDPAIVDLNLIEVNLNGIVFNLNESAFFTSPSTVGATNGTPKTHTVDFEVFQVTVVPEFSTLTMTVLALAALCCLRQSNIRDCGINSRISRVKA
jgi:hypothetical protein